MSGRRMSIAIIGAGFGGIGLAMKLKRAGWDRFTIFERASGVGGTWWHNVYPGAEVDTPSVLYSYSFEPWNWSRTHVRQAELQEYIAAMSTKYDITRHISFGVDITRTIWDERRQQWLLYAGEECVGQADAVVSAVGLLSDPRYPDWPGLETFRGPCFHTSKWEYEHDLVGKRVGVVGSGSTAIQVVPTIAQDAAHVTMFQREPGWMVPKGDREFTAPERAAMHSRLAQRIARILMLIKRERAQFLGRGWRPGTKEHTAAQRAAENFIQRTLGSRPDLIELVTPKYTYMGKRPIISDDFYPALLRDDVTLVPRAVKRVTETGVVDAEGYEHELDALVLSTGFKAEFLSTLEVVGRDGIELHDFWAGEPRAFLGMMVPGFPNFFMLYGPNTNSGGIVTNLEVQSSYVIAALRHMHRNAAVAVEVRERAFEEYDRLLMKTMEGTAFTYENNYFKSGSGRITTQWPHGVIEYAMWTKILRGAPFWRLTHHVGSSAVSAKNLVRGRAAEAVSA